MGDRKLVPHIFAAGYRSVRIWRKFLSRKGKNLRSKNHFVSKGYLRNWCGSESELWSYRTLVSNENVNVWKKVSPKAVAYHLHLYSRLKDQKLDDEVERWFDKEFESPAQGAINRALSDSRLSMDDWNKLIKFVALHDARTPARLKDHMERAQESLSEILSELEEDLSQKHSEWKAENRHPINNRDLIPLQVTPIYEEGEEKAFLKIESYIGRSTWLFSLNHILNNTIEILHNHKWTIVRPYKGMKWFTSDNPVIRLNFISQDQYDLKGGWGVKRGNILFPLDPEHLLFTEIGCNPPMKGTRFSNEQTLFIRKIIAENSYRMIFSSEPDPDIERYAPRVVDQGLFRQEQEKWKKWHEENTLMEAKFKK